MIQIHSRLKDYFIDFKDSLSEDCFDHYDLIIVDSNVLNLHKDTFNNQPKSKLFEVEVDESKKTLDYAAIVLTHMVETGLNKRSKLAAVGGGVIQDLAGFVSNIYFRGINWDYFPTTLLAMGDSCIGGKTSINFNAHKNILGTFYPPENIIAAPNFLSTLPIDDFMSGLSEVVKINLVEAEYTPKEIVRKSLSAKLEDGSLGELIRNTLLIKKTIIEEDEFDTGKRNQLNFGHCIGHALENASEFAIPHGLAVLVGMGASGYVSAELGIVSEEFAQQYAADMDNFYVVKNANDYLDPEKIIPVMLKDKKRIMDGLSVVCPLPDGGVKLIHDINPELVISALDNFKRRFSN